MKHSIFLTSLFFAGSIWAAEPINDLQKAEQLMQRYKYADAAKLYEGVAKSAENPAQRDIAQLKYALCFGKMRKVNEGLKAAEALKNPQVKEYAEMSVLCENNRFAEIVRRFAGTDLDKWPEEYQYRGWYMRGLSFASTRQYERGLKELARAEELAGADTDFKMSVWEDAALAAEAAKKYDLALQIAEKSLKHREFANNHRFLNPVMVKTRILISRKQFDEAEKTLNLCLIAKLDKAMNTWGYRFRITQGDLAFARGNKTDARKSYEQARICAGKNKYLIGECDKKLKAAQ